MIIMIPVIIIYYNLYAELFTQAVNQSSQARTTAASIIY